MRRSRPRIALAAPLLLLCLALLAPAAASASTSASGIVCTTYNAEAGTAIVRFGYSNGPGGGYETVLPGDFNFFSPPPLDRGQPDQFIAGSGFFDQPLAAGQTIYWQVNGTTATPDLAVADLPFERPCPERGPSISAVTPTAAAPGGTRLLTIFGQGLAGASVAVSGAGVSVSAPTASTGQALDATITVAADAPTGARDVLVTAPGGEEVGCQACLLIEPEAAGASGPAGPQGERGPAGPQGERGPAGPSGSAGTVTHVTGAGVRLGRHGAVTAKALCPAGSAAISGGYRVGGHGSPSALTVLADQAKGTRGWEVSARARGARSAQRLVASVTCLG